MSDSKHLFFLMNHLFYGIALGLLYGIISSFIIWSTEPASVFQKFHHAFFISFNCVFSGGLIIAAALLIHRTQSYIPDLIEDNFDGETLTSTTYDFHKERYFSPSRSISFSSSFVIIGFGIYYHAQFPFSGNAEYLLIAYGCLQYGLGVYVGRKLFYIAQMLQAIENIRVDEDIFSDDKIGGIATYVNAVTTLTSIFVFVHVVSYFNAPFEYTSLIGESIKIALLLPAVIATPVLLLFNFYPRTVLQKLYMRSINKKTDMLKFKLRDNNISEFERISYAIEYDKICKDELKYRLRLSLSDLPILAITILGMLLSLIS